MCLSHVLSQMTFESNVPPPLFLYLKKKRKLRVLERGWWRAWHCSNLTMQQSITNEEREYLITHLPPLFTLLAIFINIKRMLCKVSIEMMPWAHSSSCISATFFKVIIIFIVTLTIVKIFNQEREISINHEHGEAAMNTMEISNLFKNQATDTLTHLSRAPHPFWWKFHLIINPLYLLLLLLICLQPHFWKCKIIPAPKKSTR